MNSPYVYCNGNPVRYVDPDGRDWVERNYDGVAEIYYDRSVTSQADVDKEYGRNSGVSHIKTGTSRFGYTFENDDVNNRNGRVYDSNGNQISQNAPIQTREYDIFVGTGDNCVDAKTLHGNMFGTSYTGPDNPMTYENEDGKRQYNYDYIPRNFSEIYSMMHDLSYDKLGAEGKDAAFYNLDVLGADWTLVKGNISNLGAFYNTSIVDKGRSAATVIGFGFICGIKGVRKIYNKIK